MANPAVAYRTIAARERDCNMVLLPIPEQGASNVIGKSAFCTCLLLGVATAAIGQSRQENLNKCKSVDSDTRIVGCTALIQAGQDTPKNLSAIYNHRGNAYYDKGDYDRAIQDYDQAIRLDPSDILYDARGDACKKKDDFDRAIQDFNEAIHLNPTLERAFYDRGGAYIDKDDYDRAIQDFNEAIHLNSNDANAYNNRGVAYHKKDDYGRAIQDYNQAIRLNPNYTSAYVSRGYAYFAQSNLTAAITDFMHTVSATPSSNQAVYAALMLHVIMKRQGHDDAQQLARVEAAADLSKWPGPVLMLDLGQMTADEVVAVAASPGSDKQKWRVCEGNYFTGEDALLHHQRTTALTRFKAARDGCPKGDTDYALALAELTRLGAPAAPDK
jgi:tetratricopeptide (TPR) repeat protein